MKRIISFIGFLAASAVAFAVPANVQTNGVGGDLTNGFSTGAKTITVSATGTLAVDSSATVTGLLKANGDGSGLTNVNASTIQSVSSISSLKSYSVSGLSSGYQISVSGYYNSGDGGGGLFTYNSSSSASDNGGTIIQPNTGSGRWIRVIPDGPIDVRIFGAVPDGVRSTPNVNGTDRLSRLQAAQDACRSLYIPDNGFDLYVSGTWLIDSYTTISGPPTAIIKQSNGISAPIIANRHYISGGTGDRDISIYGCGFDLNFQNGGSIYGGIYCGALSFFNMVQGQNSGTLRIKGSMIRYVGGFCIHIGNVNDYDISDIYIPYSPRDGVHVNGPSARGKINNIYGTCGDDMVAINAWEWIGFSPTVGAISDIDIRRVTSLAGSSNVIRILVGTTDFANAPLDCSVSNLTASGVYGGCDGDPISAGHQADGPNPGHTSGPGTITGLRISELMAVSTATPLVKFNPIGGTAFSDLVFDSSVKTSSIGAVTVQGTSAGASILIGESANGDVTITPSGTGVVTSPKSFVSTKTTSTGVGAFTAASNAPRYRWVKSDGSFDQKIWDIKADTDGAFEFRAVNDVETAASTWMTVNRSGYTITSVSIPTGVVASAAALATARTINGVSFDGTANIIVPPPTSYTAVAAGTAYTLTGSFADVDFGTTDPVITISNAGNYLLTVDCSSSLNAATTVSGQSVEIILHRTNNTPADIGTVRYQPLPASTLGTADGPSVSIAAFPYTAGAGDIVTVQAKITGTLGAGSVTINNAHIVAVPR